MKYSQLLAGGKPALRYAILLVSVFFGLQANAQRVQPMVFEIEPIGAKAATSLRIENTQQNSMTVEIIPTKIIMDEYGRETLTPADDDFLIYPPQTLIEKGKTQVVRVKYIGDPTITSSQAYRVSVKQLPVDLKHSGHTGVGMVINFNTLVNVVPKDAEPAVSIVGISQGENEHWNLEIKNDGDRFSRLSKTVWQVSDTSDSSKTKRIKSLDVGKLTERNLVLPNSVLKMSIPAIEGFKPETTEIAIVGG